LRRGRIERSISGMMIIGVVLATVLMTALVVSVALVVRDMRRLHRTGKVMTERSIDADGVSSAGMTFFGQTGSH
jgi:hypothetical protein